MDAKKGGMTFGQTVRALREKKNITLRKFAARMGMSPTYLSKIERNELLPPGEEKVKAIAQALEQDPDEFLALAGRVDSDLPAIIKEQPIEMATFLRTAKGMSSDQIRKLTEEAERQKARG